MAAERPPLDQIFLNTRRGEVLDRPPLEEVFTSSRHPSIYSKGGVYDQFGPNPRTFNPFEGAELGPANVGARQPGSALPFVGQTAGGTAFGPAGGVVGALAGEGVRQVIGRKFGVQDEADPGKQFKAAGKAALYGELFGAGANRLIQGAGRAIEAAKPGAKANAVRMARNILRPTGRYAKKGERIAETSLKEGAISSDLKRVGEKTAAKMSAVQDEIDNLINQYEGEGITAEGALKRMDALARRYRQLGDPDSASKVLKVKNDIIQSQGLMEPVYGEKETSQFVMGPASKQVTPQITKTYSSDIRGPLKGLKGKARYESVRKESGKFGRSEPKRDVFTPKKNVESPDDIVAMNIPKQGAKTQKIVSVSPKETYQLRPETKGVSKKETVIVGQKPREISLREAQAIKKGQYRLMEGKRVGAGYDASTTTPEIAGRQAYAGGFKRDIAKRVPQVDPLNRRFGDLIDLSTVAKNREAITGRNNPVSLTDVILATGGFANPKAWAALFGKKIAEKGAGFGARQLYKFGTSGPMQIPQVSPAIRALLSSQLRN